MKIEFIDTETERRFLLKDESLSTNIITLQEEMKKFIKFEKRNAVIDLTHVAKIDSMALSAIIRMKNQLAESGRELNLVNPCPSALKILELSGLDQFLLE